MYAGARDLKVCFPSSAQNAVNVLHKRISAALHVSLLTQLPVLHHDPAVQAYPPPKR